jgi:hypothetical protein
LNSGLYACKAGALPPEPHLWSSIFVQGVVFINCNIIAYMIMFNKCKKE